MVNFKGERDTIVVCIRGDGKRMPLFWIKHKRKGQIANSIFKHYLIRREDCWNEKEVNVCLGKNGTSAYE